MAARIWIHAQESRIEALEAAVRVGGGSVSAADEANAIVWATDEPAAIRPVLHDDIAWVQLSSAGIEEWFAGVVDSRRVWTAAKGVYADPIAEYCLTALLAAARSLPLTVRNARWGQLDVTTLAGSVVGILGCGGIGRALLRLLAPFGVKVLALTRSGGTVAGADESLGPRDLERMLAAVDFVVLALPLTPATERLLDDTRLRLLRKTAWIVNVGRGGLIDTSALVSALEEGRIGGAVLDVTDPEPLPEDHALWSLRNAVITSHTACTPQLGSAVMAERVCENVRRFNAGEPLYGVVDVEARY